MNSSFVCDECYTEGATYQCFIFKDDKNKDKQRENCGSGAVADDDDNGGELIELCAWSEEQIFVNYSKSDISENRGLMTNEMRKINM